MGKGARQGKKKKVRHNRNISPAPRERMSVPRTMAERMREAWDAGKDPRSYQGMQVVGGGSNKK